MPADLDLEGRISLDPSVVILDQVKASDVGQFKVMDILGFPVSNVYLEVEGEERGMKGGEENRGVGRSEGWEDEGDGEGDG